jgi:hypothetical protein
MGWTTGVRLPVGIRDISLLHSSGAHPASIQWVRGPLSLGLKRLGREADYSPRSSADVKNGGAVPSLPHTSLVLN